MIAQQGALSVVAGSHMAETDGETFSRLTSKLQSSDIQSVFEQLSVKVALPCPDLYGSFPDRLAELHLKMRGQAGSLNIDSKKPTSKLKKQSSRTRMISRIGIWSEGFTREVSDNVLAVEEKGLGRASEDNDDNSIARIRLREAIENKVLKKRKRNSELMLDRYKRIKGQSGFYSEVFKSFPRSHEDDSNAM